MKTLITGSSRGIGFALVAQALARGESVYAVARDVTKLKGLQGDYLKTLTLIEANVSTPAGIKVVVAAIEKSGSLDTLINNAGVYKKSADPEDFSESFHVNATTPYLLSKALIPALTKSKSPKVIQISTLMSSIADNTAGGSYAYRASKSALNMLTKCMAIEYPNVTFALMHPGWVKTDMGGDGAPTEVEDSAKGLWKVINALNLKDSGAFKSFRGKNLPW